MFKSHEFEESDADSVLFTLLSMEDTCALDIADRGTHTQEELSHLMNVERPRVAQIEATAMVRSRRGGLPRTDGDNG
jgi:DNA-directed RNA polymerase sigma subunit (sigma70/sigma32)